MVLIRNMRTRALNIESGANHPCPVVRIIVHKVHNIRRRARRRALVVGNLELGADSRAVGSHSFRTVRGSPRRERCTPRE